MHVLQSMLVLVVLPRLLEAPPITALAADSSYTYTSPSRLPSCVEVAAAGAVGAAVLVVSTLPRARHWYVWRGGRHHMHVMSRLLPKAAKVMASWSRHVPCMGASAAALAPALAAGAAIQGYCAAVAGSLAALSCMLRVCCLVSGRDAGCANALRWEDVVACRARFALGACLSHARHVGHTIPSSSTAH